MEKIHLAKLYHDNFITQAGGRDRFIAWAEKYNIVSRAKTPRKIRKAMQLNTIKFPITDHMYTFKTADGQIICTTQPYACSDNDESFLEAKEKLLKMKIQMDFIGEELSWWYPPMTALIHITEIKGDPR